MGHINESTRCWVALAVWGAGLMLAFSLSLWNLSSSRKDAENRLISEAGRAAAQIAKLASLPDGRVDAAASRAIVAGAMEDENIYAIKIETRQGILEGLRRNYLWEPVEWDDEIAENCVQGMNPIKVDGHVEGMVEVWLSPRLTIEEDSMLGRREKWRFLCIALLWTGVLGLLFWHWGDFGRWRRALFEKSQPDACEPPDKIMLGLSREHEADAPGQTGLVNASAGREFQNKNPEAWLVTAGLFRQTFARAPELISRLYAEGATAGLCHLGRMLEQAAPCIGASPLVEAASRMQAALNDPDSVCRALAVEDCARVLEQTLAALQGAQSGPVSPREK